MFVDDHAAIHCFTNPAEITTLIAPILDHKAEWGFTTNMDKSFALLKIQGKGCRKKVKNLANKIKLDKHGTIRVTQSSKYLGAILNTDGNMNEEIGQRIKKPIKLCRTSETYGDLTSSQEKCKSQSTPQW